MLLLAAMMLVRGLIPTGFMPAIATADGAFQLVICTGGGLMTVDVPSDGQAPVTARDDCAFASAVAPVLLPPAVATLPAPTVLLLAVMHDQECGRVPHRAVIGVGARAPPRGARES